MVDQYFLHLLVGVRAKEFSIVIKLLDIRSLTTDELHLVFVSRDIILTKIVSGTPLQGDSCFVGFALIELNKFTRRSQFNLRLIA